jgi:hypothetical protein
MGMKEIIFGDYNEYKLTEDARFFSMVNRKGRAGKIIVDYWTEKTPCFKKSDYTGSGYLVVSATYNGMSVHYLHRLMAQIFIKDKRDDQTQVNHIDGNRLNNHISNLEWSTPQENIENAKNRGAFNGKNLFNGKIDEFSGLTIATLINSGWGNIKISDHYGIDKSNISKIRNKDTSFKWLHSLIRDDVSSKSVYEKRKNEIFQEYKSGKSKKDIMLDHNIKIGALNEIIRRCKNTDKSQKDTLSAPFEVARYAVALYESKYNLESIGKV